MNNQAECYQALLDGKTLVFCGYDTVEYSLIDGNLSADGVPAFTTFASPCKFSIKREVPQINPLLVPIDWWGVAMDQDKKWFRYYKKPSGGGHHWESSCDISYINEVHAPSDYTGTCQDSAFTRAELATA